MERQELLKKVSELRLPLGHYFVTGSGPLCVRGIREANDVDIQVDDELWTQLESQYGVSQDGEILSLGPGVDAHRDAAYEPLAGAGHLAERIREADVIDGVAFMNLKHTRAFKRAKGRAKDLEDIRLLDAWEEQEQ